MTCNEVNCTKFSCALCYHCDQSLCVNHIIIHHHTLLERHLTFYEVLQQLYRKLHSMSIEQCYRQVYEQLASNEVYSSSDIIFHVRSIREELIEQLNRFKQKQFGRLQRISSRLHDTKQTIDNDEATDIQYKLEQIQTSINSLVYGIRLEVSQPTKSVTCRKIFHHKPPAADEETNLDALLQKSSSWTDGATENYWKRKMDAEERLSLF